MYRRSCKLAVSQISASLRLCARLFFYSPSCILLFFVAHHPYRGVWGGTLFSFNFSAAFMRVFLNYRVFAALAVAGSLPKVVATKFRRNRRSIEEVASLQSPKISGFSAPLRELSSSLPPPVFSCSLWLIIFKGRFAGSLPKSPVFSCSLWLIIFKGRFAGSLPKVVATKCRRNRRSIEEVASLQSPKSPRLCATF